MELAKLCKEELFFEALKHCRHKTILNNFISSINVECFKNKSFEEIFLQISLGKVKGSIGVLSVYDIASDIFRYHGGIINKVYIIGRGPKRAIKLLGIKKKLDTTVGLYFVEIEQVTSKLNLTGVIDGDLVETYICQWQKTIRENVI